MNKNMVNNNTGHYFKFKNNFYHEGDLIESTVLEFTQDTCPEIVRMFGQFLLGCGFSSNVILNSMKEYLEDYVD